MKQDSPPDSILEPYPETSTVNSAPRWQRTVLRTLALALLCGALQYLLPHYTLGTAALAPLSVVLGVAVAAAMSRGRWTVPAALVGVLVAEWFKGSTVPAALISAGILGLQSMLAGWLMRHSGDPDVLRLDNAARLRRFVLVAAPAAAMLGVVAGVMAQWGVDAAASVPLVRPHLAGAVGRFIADAAGIIVTAPVLLCWLAQPQGPWRPRRRMMALPLLVFVAVMLPGLDQVAKRDELRLQGRFARDGEARRQRIQQLLTDPIDATLALRGVLAAGGENLAVPLFDQLAAGWSQRVAGLGTLGWIERVADGNGQFDLVLKHAFTPAGSSLVVPGAHVGADGRLTLAPTLRRAIDKAFATDVAVALPATGRQPVSAAPAGASASAPASQTATLELPAANPGLLVLQSVPASAGNGQTTRLVLAVVDARRLLVGAMPDDDDSNVRACLTENTTDPDHPRHRLAGAPGCENDVIASALRAQPYRVQMGEQRFDLLVSEPATAENRLFTAVWLLGLPTVVGASMLSALLLALSGRLRRIEDRVRERTAALQAEIDERRQTERALGESEQRFRAIFDSVNIGVTLVDNDGVVVQANPAFCTMMGGTLTDVLGKPLADIQLPDVHEDDGTAVAVGGGQARRQRYLTVDGRVLQVAANLRTLYDAQGHNVATVGALQDLTQVLRLRDAEREREQAEIASRTKSEFLARLSHELRAPLNAIVGFAQMLGKAGDNEHSQVQQQHGLNQIRQAGWHLLDMINDVLDLSRMEAGSLRLTLEPTSLADLAQEAMAMVEPAALEAGVTLDLSLSPQADRVQADPLRLRQVLINLLGNAIKYNHRGGTVSLRTRPGAVGEVMIEVEDNGLGMSEEQLGQLFTPFNRLGREQAGHGSPGSQGTGIGLVICRKLTQMMGGEISVASREAQGSVFSLRLPRPVGEPTRTQVTTQSHLVSHVSIGTVLYIEDNEGDIEAMRSLMTQRPGITLVCVRTAAEGLAQAHDADLVLLDLDLPDRPGLEVMRELQADSRKRTVPVIVVSAESRPQRIDECFDAGASQFLTKPLEPQQTLRAIDSGLNNL